MIFGTVGDPSQITTIFVQSADPDDLEARVNAALAGVDGINDVVTSIVLAGAGDGHTFVVEIDTAPATATVGGLPAGLESGVPVALVRCFLAGDAEGLETAKTAAGIPASVVSGQVTIPYALVDEELAGGAKGTQFMGMSVFALSSIPLGVLTPVATARLTSNQVLGAGANLIGFTSLGDIVSGFTLPAAQTLHYTGPASILAIIDASVTVEQTGANDVTVAVVLDPLGAQTVLESITTHVVAGDTDTVSVPALAVLLPAGISPTNIGILVTAGGAGNARSAVLRVVKIG